MKPSGAHTHPHSGGTHTLIIAVITAVVLAATAAGPAAHAVAALLRAVILTVAAVIVAAAAALVAVAVYRVRHPRDLPADPPWLTARAAQPQASPAPSRAALGHAATPAIHLHLYGMSAQDVTEVLAHQPITANGQDRGDRHAAP
jgi:hypothetical protein